MANDERDKVILNRRILKVDGSCKNITLKELKKIVNELHELDTPKISLKIAGYDYSKGFDPRMIHGVKKSKYGEGKGGEASISKTIINWIFE